MQSIDTKKKSLFREFLKYLIPSISAMWFFSIYTMIDGMFVGKGVGSTALSAVNLSMPFINTIFSISILVAVGSSTLITFHLGENKKQLSDEIFTLTFSALAIFSLILTVLSLIFLDKIVIFLGATPETFSLTKEYLSIVIISSTFYTLSYYLEVIVKADGFPIFSIVFVALGAIANILFDYIFVILFDFGIKGAAVATVIAQMISCIGFLHHFIYGKSNLKFVKCKISLKYLIKTFSIGLPEFLSELALGFNTLIFNFVIIKHIGDYGLAAFSVIMYINNLVIMTMSAINQAMQPLISYYNGCDDPKKISKLLYFSLRAGLICGLIFFLISQIFAKNLVSLFINSSDIDIFNLSVYALRIFSFSFLITGFNIILSGFFTALKLSKISSVLTVMRGYIFISIFLLSLSSMFGETSIWFANIANEIFALVISFYLYWFKIKPFQEKLSNPIGK